MKEEILRVGIKARDKSSVARNGHNVALIRSRGRALVRRHNWEIWLLPDSLCLRAELGTLRVCTARRVAHGSLL